jgi:hypothetical protein
MILVFLASSPARAEAPHFVPLQGILTDKDGVPIDGPVNVIFALYDGPQGGKQLWSESQTVTVEDGLFLAYLGFDKPLEPSFFRDNSNLWLSIAVAGDPEMQRVFLGSVPFSAYAEHCGQAPEHAHEASSLKGVVAANQWCEVGQYVNGFDFEGAPSCVSPAAGQGYALSGQSCPPQSCMMGTDSNGYPVCAPSGIYSGADFALSGQDCSSGKVVTGISSSGMLECAAAEGGGIAGSGSDNYLAKFNGSTEIEKSVVYESSGKVGINDSSPSQTLDVEGNLRVSGEIHWGGNKFSSSSCLVVGGSSCSSACSAHGMSCYKAFRIDGDSTSDSCSQSGFKFCCCTD